METPTPLSLIQLTHQTRHTTFSHSLMFVRELRQVLVLQELFLSLKQQAARIHEDFQETCHLIAQTYLQQLLRVI